jgi:four helix bundle protein
MKGIEGMGDRKMEGGKKKWLLKEKSYKFAIRIVRLTQYLRQKKRETIMSKQVLRSGTAIGALIREAEFAQSKADFVNKLSVSLKEANETAYWLSLLKDTEYIDATMFESISLDCEELLCILVASIKTTKDGFAPHS